MSQTIDRTVSAHAVERVAHESARTRSDRLLDQVIERTISSGFDADAFHVMDARDTRLIQDEILGGPRSSKFMYNFSIQGSAIQGISAVGARELATHYKGIRHRLVSSTRKVRSLFVFTTYASPGIPASMQTQVLPELTEEPDGYEAVVEITDIKTGNVMMAAKFEAQFEWSSGKKTWFEKPHFATIAQSKAQRNGILMIIPQSIQLEWMQSLKSGNQEVITGSVLAEKRDGVLRYGASQGIPIDREVLQTILLEQIAGLAEAARTKSKDDFLASAVALGLTPASGPVDETTTDTGTKRTSRSSRPPPTKPSADRPDPREQTADNRPPPTQTTGAPVASSMPTAGHDAAIPPSSERASPPPVSDDAAAEIFAFDEFGEPLERPDPMTAMEFAKWFATAMTGATTPEALREHNADAIADAGADPDAAKIIQAAIDGGTTQNSAPVTQSNQQSERKPVVPPVTPKGGIHWPNYAEACAAELANCPDQAAIDAWVELNELTYTKKAIEAGIKRRIRERRQQIDPGWGVEDHQGPTTTSGQPIKPKDPAASAVVETDQQVFDRLSAEIAARDSDPAITAWAALPGTQEAMRRLGLGNRPMRDKLVSIIDQRRIDVSGVTS